MGDLVTIVLVALGFVFVLSVLALIAAKMGIPLSDLFGPEKSKGKGKVNDRGGEARVDLDAYEACGSMLSEAELKFYRVLREVVKSPEESGGEDQAVVLCKVRAADLVGVKKGLGQSRFQSAFNRISNKHVDFVLARAGDLSVLCVIELDDSSHRRGGRRDRDGLMDAIYGAAGVAVVHVACRAGYSRDEVAGVIWGAVRGEPA